MGSIAAFELEGLLHYRGEWPLADPNAPTRLFLLEE